MKPSHPPYLVVSDGQGNVFDIDEYAAVTASIQHFQDINIDDWIPLPFGSELMELPGRRPVGKNLKTNQIEVLPGAKEEGIVAVSAFVAPAYTIAGHAAWQTDESAELLSLYAYCAVGWADEQFWVPALRIDPDIRQDYAGFNENKIKRSAPEFLKRYPRNRLVEHVTKNCALTYGCPAARNYLLNRWEMPLPSSRACNARCLGCISWQDKVTGVCASQNRMAFVPTADELIEMAVDHLDSAPDPVASFGQGCEGEPLMNPDLLITTVQGIRKKTSKGVINLNTNGSKPKVIEKLAQNGLQSIRVSMNSARRDYYLKYYKPVDYSFEDILESMRIMKTNGGFVSINYFVFPGFTDQADEIRALETLLDEGNIDLIQWRNLNIDPDWYIREMGIKYEETIGISKMIDSIKQKYPKLRHGYFNPAKL